MRWDCEAFVVVRPTRSPASMENWNRSRASMSRGCDQIQDHATAKLFNHSALPMASSGGGPSFASRASSASVSTIGV
jgi:hypothetical protein